MAACAAALLLVVPAAARTDRAKAAAEVADASPGAARVARAWRTLRAIDCARCHGRDYEGLAAPSIVDYVRTQSREAFVRMLLDGDPGRGMPGYRGNPWIAQDLDGIYQYFVGRANGAIGAAWRP